MKLKAILILTMFFIGTPLILGQTQLPSIPSLPGTPTGLPIPSTPGLPTFSTPSVPSGLPLDSLRDAGINTASLSSPSQAASSLLSSPTQGILNSSFSTPLPNRDNAADLAKEFAKRTFPEEFNAAQGKLTNFSSLANSASSFSTPTVPTSIPTPSGFSTPTIPSIPALPGTPTLPSLPSLPSTPTLPSLPSTPTIPSTPTLSTPIL